MMPERTQIHPILNKKKKGKEVRRSAPIFYLKTDPVFYSKMNYSYERENKERKMCMILERTQIQRILKRNNGCMVNPIDV